MIRTGLDADVLVVGGGLAGIAAATAAGRTGARTVLVEWSDTLGGAATLGLNCSFMGVDKKLMGGVFAEMMDELAKRNGAVSGVYTPCSPEVLKDVAFDLLASAGVQVLFRMWSDDVIMAGQRVEGVIFRHKRGRDTIGAKVTVDATGDADVAAAAGAEYELGDPATGEMQPLSMLFRMGNVNTKAVVEYVQSTPEQFYSEPLLFVCDASTDPPLMIANGFFDWVRTQRQKGLYLGREAVAVIKTPDPGEVLINATRISDVNALDPYELSRAIIDTRRQLRSLVEHLKEAMPGFEKAYLIDSSAQIGVRETRRIVGIYQITEDDVREGREFEDRIARNFFPIDIHGPKSNPIGYTWIVPKDGRAYSIPYRCLVPKQIDGLLVAGRCISATHVALGSIRTMPCCVATGQAAGVAAALAAKEAKQPRDLNPKEVQRMLEQQRVPLGKGASV